jgi:nucleotide-binding universal stress UspA family protein
MNPEREASDDTSDQENIVRYGLNQEFSFCLSVCSGHGAGTRSKDRVVEPIPPMVKHYVKGFVDEIKWEEKIQYEQQVAVEQIKNRIAAFCERQAKLCLPCLELVSATLVRIGHPVDEILKAADEETCDLLILGTHGKGFLKHTFLGSVARSVSDRTRKPVFVVPLPEGDTDVSFEEI